MHDALLELARGASMEKSALIDLVALLLYVSDGVYVADIGSTAVGSTSMTLHLDCTEGFAANVGAVTVEWLLISTASEASVLTEVALAQYNLHWRSGPTPASGYVAGRRMFTVPLPPTRSLKPYLCLIGTFTDAGVPLDGLSAGRVNIRIAASPDNARFDTFPNAI